MSTLEHYPRGSGSRNLTRHVGRDLTRIEANTSVALAHLRACEDVQMAQVEAMAAVTQRGLQAVAFISQVEQQLAQAIPLAGPRLQAVSDIGALGISQVVMDTANSVRRWSR